MCYMNTTALQTQHTHTSVCAALLLHLAPHEQPSLTRLRRWKCLLSWKTPERNRWNHVPCLCGADRGRGEQQLFNLLVIKRSILVFLVHRVQRQILFFTHWGVKKVTLNLIPSTLYGSNHCQIPESKESCDRKQDVVEVREEFHGDTKVPVTVTVQMWRTLSRRNLSASTVGIFCKLPSTTINHHLFSLCLMLFVQKIISCGYSVNQLESSTLIFLKALTQEAPKTGGASTSAPSARTGVFNWKSLRSNY